MREDWRRRRQQRRPQAVGQALQNIDRGLERMQAVRGYAGELLNRADRITGNQENAQHQLEADRSRPRTWI